MSALDLTQSNIYTLSPGTRQILRRTEGADHAAAVLLARSSARTVPVYGAYADHVREMLREYAALRTARSSWNFTIPSRSATPRTARWPTACKACRSISAGTQVYFGLAGTNLLDDERTIPFFQPERERFLEYDLTQAGLRTVQSEAHRSSA